MDLIDLLDKQQKTSFRMIQLLINHQFQLTIEELLAEIDVSLPTIQKEVNQLKEDLLHYDNQATLHINEKNRVQLKLPLSFSLKDFFYSHYYSKSINLKLIESFFFQKETSIAKLTLEFQLSEASLFRRLKQINSLFQEFDLKYKNNRLIGSASAYQFFYFDFFSAIYPRDVLKKIVNRTSFIHLIKIIETNLICHFTQNQADNFVLWLAITEKKINDSLLNAKKTLVDSPFTIDDAQFQELEQIFIRFSSRYAIQWPREEILSAYHFLLAQGVISYSFDEKNPSVYLAKIDQLTRIIVDELAPNAIELQKVIYTNLFTAHCQLTFFHHLISNDFATYYLLSDSYPTLMDSCMIAVEKKLNFAISTNQWQKLDAIYGRIYSFVESKKQAKTADLVIYLGISEQLLIEETKEFLATLTKRFPTLDIQLTPTLGTETLILAEANQEVLVAAGIVYQMQDQYWTPFERYQFTTFLSEQLQIEGMS